MKTDFVLFFISLFFSLVGLLLEDVFPVGTQVIAVLKYLPILLLYAKYFKWKFISLLPILFAAFLFLLSFLRGHYSYVGMLVTVMLPISIYVFTKIRLTRRDISRMKLMMAIAFFLYAIVIISRQFDINPNQESFKILIISVNLFFCIFTNSERNRIVSMPGLCLLLFSSLVLIVYTGCRNSLLVFLLLALAFICRRRVARMNIWGLIMAIVLILFILYPFTYCLLADNLHNSSQNTEMLGQDVFSGRQYIWSYIFAQCADPAAFCFGNIDMDWWGKSMHNSAMDIVVRYGVPTAIVLMLIILYYFKRVSSLVFNKYKSLLLLIVVTMIWGLNESGMFLGFSFFLFMPYCILLSKNNDARLARARSEA